MSEFIGRQQELDRLKLVMKKDGASLIILKGRRRIGKSRLILEYGKHFKHFYSFRGLAPTPRTRKKDQLDEFSRQLSENFDLPQAYYHDWGNALLALAKQCKTGQTLIALDEISWMGSKDPLFLSKLKDIWDTYLSQNSKLILIICGSASSWIERHIMTQTGFVGRISSTLTLEALPLSDCRAFWGKQIALHEQLKVLSITGGIPKYLEEIDPRLSAEDNIRNLCFTPGGFLVDEFRQIFSDILLRDSTYYVRALKTLCSGPKNLQAIQDALGLSTPGRLAEYLWELELAGFIARDYTWNIRTTQDSKLSLYRLKDNYIRFYLKVIDKNLTKIQRGGFAYKSLASLPGWDGMMGLQIENLILSSRASIFKALNLSPSDIVSENPYYQKATSTKKGCQIDYLIQTHHGTVFVCEIKSSKSTIGCDVIAEVQAKIDALTHPRGISFRPVLIHVNGVSEALVETHYFSDIIDAESLF